MGAPAALPFFPSLLARGEVGHTEDGLLSRSSVLARSEVRQIAEFGCIGDGKTDDTAGMKAAFLWMSKKPERRLMADANATYVLTDRISVVGHCDIDWGRAQILVNADVLAFELSAELYGPFALQDDYRTGEILLKVESAQDLPLPGQPFKIMSDGLDPANRDDGSKERQFRIGEWAVVEGANPDGQWQISTPLSFVECVQRQIRPGNEPRVASYTVENRARIVYANQFATCRWAGGTIYYKSGKGASWNKGALRLVGYHEPLVSGLRVLRGYGQAVTLSGTYRARVINCTFGELANDVRKKQFGYGISDRGYKSVIENIRANNVRHAFTTSVNATRDKENRPKALIGVGRTIGAIVSDGNAGAGISTHWDTHHSGEGLTFKRVASFGGKGYGAGFRGRGIVFEGPYVRSGEEGGGLHAFTEWDSGDPDDDLFTNGKLLEDFTSGRIIDPDVECGIGRPLVCSHATLQVDGSGRFVTVNQCAVYNVGGHLCFRGQHRFSVGNHGEDAVVMTKEPNAEAAGAMGPKARTTISGTMRIDVIGASKNAVLLSAPKNSEIVVTGQLVFTGVQSGHVRRQGSIRTEGSGEIIFS